MGYAAYWLGSVFEGLVLHAYSAVPVHVGGVVGLGALGVWARAGDGRDAATSSFLGRYATHPRWGC